MPEVGDTVRGNWDAATIYEIEGFESEGVAKITKWPHHAVDKGVAGVDSLTLVMKGGALAKRATPAPEPWRPKYAVGQEVEHVVMGGCRAIISEILPFGAYKVQGSVGHWDESGFKWVLPTPPAGHEWHRVDGWTAEMLPSGTRPLCKGEKPNPVTDEVYWPEKKIWSHDATYAARGEEHLLTRTTRPAPTPPQAEPEKLCGEQEKVCPVCYHSRPLSEFSDVSNLCHLCEADAVNGEPPLQPPTTAQTDEVAVLKAKLREAEMHANYNNQTATTFMNQVKKLQTAGGALEIIGGWLKHDLEYAWSWHCNIAMACHDAGARPHSACNEGAARFLGLLFPGVDTTKHPAYASTQEQSTAKTAAEFLKVWFQRYWYPTGFSEEFGKEAFDAAIAFAQSSRTEEAGKVEMPTIIELERAVLSATWPELVTIPALTLRTIISTVQDACAAASYQACATADRLAREQDANTIADLRRENASMAIELQAIIETSKREVLDVASERSAREKAEKERDELQAWKESAMSVFPPVQEIARELGDIPLGASIHDKIVPGIQKLKAELAEMKEQNPWPFLRLYGWKGGDVGTFLNGLYTKVGEALMLSQQIQVWIDKANRLESDLTATRESLRKVEEERDTLGSAMDKLRLSHAEECKQFIATNDEHVKNLTSLKASSGWVALSERRPTREDADERGNVLWRRVAPSTGYEVNTWNWGYPNASTAPGWIWLSIKSTPPPSPEAEERIPLEASDVPPGSAFRATGNQNWSYPFGVFADGIMDYNGCNKDNVAYVMFKSWSYLMTSYEIKRPGQDWQPCSKPKGERP